LPEGPTIFLGHEFLDALPIHQFQYTERGWLEKLVDVERDEDKNAFRFVLSPGPTVASRMFDRFLPYGPSLKHGDRVEICPQALSLSVAVARHIQQYTGVALFIDYGRFHSFPESLRGIYNQKARGVLEDPGNVDISASVDFAAMDKVVRDAEGIDLGLVNSFPSISQQDFLLNIGIDARLAQLIRRAPETKALISGHQRLLYQMGEEYHTYAIASPGVIDHYLRHY